MRERGALQDATWDELEVALLRADVGVGTTEALLADLRRRVQSKEVSGGAQLVGALRADLIDLLAVDGVDELAAGAAHPADGNGAVGVPASRPTGRELRFDTEDGVTNVWLFVGVNGVGKTTTVGKVARQQSRSGRSVLLAAGDTFRAAAGEQLETWAERSDVEIVRGAEGGDPSAIVFDAVQRAANRGNDLVLADTAGRLHTKVNLVEELKKIPPGGRSRPGPGDRGPPRPRRDDGAERAGAGQTVHRGRVGHRAGVDQARRVGKGGHRHRCATRAGNSRQARGPW